MERIEEYTVLTTIYYSGLIKDVNDKIKKGWQPFGNLATTQNPKQNKMGGENNQIEYSQAMVKYVGDIINKQKLND